LERVTDSIDIIFRDFRMEEKTIMEVKKDDNDGSKTRNIFDHPAHIVEDVPINTAPIITAGS